MAHMGHPILGDELHGGKSAFFGTRFKKHRHSPCRLARKNIMRIPNLRHCCPLRVCILLCITVPIFPQDPTPRARTGASACTPKPSPSSTPCLAES
jgi:hypothetical protein